MNSPQAKTTGWSVFSTSLLVLMLLASACLCLNCFVWPFTPVWLGSDEFGYILDASRMWRGERIYKDFFQFIPPGTALVYISFFRLFGLRNWIPNLTSILVGLLSTWEVVLIGRKLIGTSRSLALLPGLVLLTYLYRGETHRWFSSAAVFAALAVLLEGKQQRHLALCGILCALSSFFTQTQGVFAVGGFVVFLLWESRQIGVSSYEIVKRVVWLVAPFAAAVLAMYAYFIWKAGIDSTLDCLVSFILFYHPLDRENFSFHVYVVDFPKHFALSGLPQQFFSLLIHLLVPFIYIAFLVVSRRWKSMSEERSRLVLISILGLFLFFSVAPASSYFRMITVSPPALVLFAYWLNGEGRLKRITVAVVLFVCAFSLIRSSARVQMEDKAVLQLPRGPIAFADQDAIDRETLAWLSSHTEPKEIFFAGDGKGLFFPLALVARDKDVGYDDTGQTRPKDIQDAIATLEKYHVRLIQWPAESCDPRFYRAEEDHLAPLNEYVRMHYHEVKRFGSPDDTQNTFVEIWQRND